MKRCVVSGLTEPVRHVKTSHRIPHANDLDRDVEMSTALQMLESRSGEAAWLRADDEWDSSQLARFQLAGGPLGLVKSLLAPFPVDFVDVEEMIHEQRCQETDLADEPSQGPRRVSAARETKDEDLIPRTIVGYEEVVGFAHVLSETAAESTYIMRLAHDSC